MDARMTLNIYVEMERSLFTVDVLNEEDIRFPFEVFRYVCVFRSVWFER